MLLIWTRPSKGAAWSLAALSPRVHGNADMAIMPQTLSLRTTYCTVADLYEFIYIRHQDFAKAGCANAEPGVPCGWVKALCKGTWTNTVAWCRRGLTKPRFNALRDLSQDAATGC